MLFEKLNPDTWDRKEYFEHYYKNVPCTYSMTVKVDITKIREKNVKLYPAMLYGLTTIVNRHREFRTAFNTKGELGIYSEMIPSYTVFHKDTETFSNLWTRYRRDFEEFQKEYDRDLEVYGNRNEMMAKPDAPENCFTVSMIPWASYEGFHLNIQSGYDYLRPIFTMGKYYEEKGRSMLPLSIQVHHAVCDGFHVCRFVNELQELING